DAAVDQLDLAAAAFLGGGPDDLDTSLRQTISNGGQRRARAGAGGGDHVVAAGVTDAGQRVVLAHDRDPRAGSGFEPAAEPCLDARGPPPDLEAMLVEDLCEPRRGLHLGIGQLRVVVNLPRELFEVGGQAVDGRSDEIFDSAHGESPEESIRPRRGRRTLYTGARMTAA